MALVIGLAPKSLACRFAARSASLCGTRAPQIEGPFAASPGPSPSLVDRPEATEPDSSAEGEQGSQGPDEVAQAARPFDAVRRGGWDPPRESPTEAEARHDAAQAARIVTDDDSGGGRRISRSG